MTIINCTPHPINIVDPETKTIKTSIKPSGIIPRCAQSSEPVFPVTIDSGITVDVVRTVFGEVTDLPPKEDGTIFVVSMIVAKACPDRDDLVIPNGLVRDDEGNIIGCSSLAVV